MLEPFNKETEVAYFTSSKREKQQFEETIEEKHCSWGSQILFYISEGI